MELIFIVGCSMIFRRSGRWYSDVSYIYTFVCAYKVFKMEVSFLCRKLNDIFNYGDVTQWQKTHFISWKSQYFTYIYVIIIIIILFKNCKLWNGIGVNYKCNELGIMRSMLCPITIGAHSCLPLLMI